MIGCFSSWCGKGLKCGTGLQPVVCGAAILHDTSNVMHRYPHDRYVGASMQLFASVALMLWYVISLLMSSRD